CHRNRTNPPLIPNQRLMLSPVPNRLQSQQTTSFDANTASFAGAISTRIWTSPTSWTDKCRFEATGNAYISGTMNVIGDILSSTGNILTTSGNMSVGSISTTGNISATGNIAVGSITTTGNITGNFGSFSWLKCTASSGRPITPTTYGAYLGNDGTA
ncbi:MAG: hypothetical protein ACKPKO_17210, partial [Candidatus Fonsibacter sp.]